MTKNSDIARVQTGVPNLDVILHGGLPKASLTVVAGPPGSGKTILTQQICFHNAAAKRKVLLFSTLSEPTAKSLRYMPDGVAVFPRYNGLHRVEAPPLTADPNRLSSGVPGLDSLIGDGLLRRSTKVGRPASRRAARP